MDIEILKLLTQYGGGALIIYLVIILIKELGKYRKSNGEKNNSDEIKRLSAKISKIEGNDLHSIGENIVYLRGEVDEIKDKIACLDKRVSILEVKIKNGQN